MQPNEPRALLSLSPSFNSYSSGKLAEIAARVVEELRLEHSSEDGDFDWQSESPLSGFQQNISVSESQDLRQRPYGDDSASVDGDDEFEFALVSAELDASSIPAGEVFYDGEIRSVYPVFDTGLLLQDSRNDQDLKKSTTPKLHRTPLGKLLNEDRETASCSSSEADDLEGISPGTYCVWTPKSAEESSPAKWKKSNSTGSSKRWKLLQILNRSNSDGKNVFVFLTPENKREKVGAVSKEKVKAEDDKLAGNVKINEVATASATTNSGSANEEVLQWKNKTATGGGRRRSFLPYRQDLVGFFSGTSDQRHDQELPSKMSTSF